MRTLATPCASRNLGLVSCNFTARSGRTDLWADLRDRFVAPRKLDVLVHMGDQVYGDSAFIDSLATLRGRSSPTRTQERNILEQYRDLYRAAWGGHEATREVLAHVSNLMIWDDHEIRDDWGSRESDKDPASPEHCVGKLARRVYREYQRQLWTDVDDTVPPVGTEHHMHVWDGIAVLFLDQRGARAFVTDRELPYLGKPQWAEVEQALAPGGALDAVRALLVVTSVPLVYLGPALSSAARHAIDDIEDHWSFGPYQTEQLQMIRRLRTWKERGGGDREVLVVGGDVHLGGYTEIRHDGTPIFRQLISSPVTNRPPAWLEFKGLKEVLEAEQQLAHGYSFEHRDCTNRRNYGIVLARIPAGPGAPTLDWVAGAGALRAIGAGAPGRSFAPRPRDPPWPLQEPRVAATGPAQAATSLPISVRLYRARREPESAFRCSSPCSSRATRGCVD